MSLKYPIVAVVGPTCSGKSELALLLAEKLDGEIVGCDSMQVYQGLDIGTAKVPPEARRQIPHHLIDVVTPDLMFSAGQYMELARKTVGQIRERGKLPLVVGGTGLYLRALLYGLFPGPGRADNLRARLKRIAEKKGVNYLHKLLGRVDAESASRINPNDGVRIVRALEVYLLSGRPISEHFKLQQDDFLSQYLAIKIGLDPPRPPLYERIDRRVERMFSEGLVIEVERLLAAGYSDRAHGFTGIGYRHVISYLKGEMTLARCIELTKRDTRRYAKRQMTWFRKEPDVTWFAGFGDDNEIQQQVLRFLSERRNKLGSDPCL